MKCLWINWTVKYYYNTVVIYDDNTGIFHVLVMLIGDSSIASLNP